jgi:hypothetical protein
VFDAIECCHFVSFIHMASSVDRTKRFTIIAQEYKEEKEHFQSTGHLGRIINVIKRSTL